METESRIFDLLDSWRDLPAYQLERRADIFFAAYLPRFLSHRSGVSVRESLIPEFPLHYGTICPQEPRGKNLSCKLDYLALSTDLRQAFFIELKTDPQSRGKIQDANMAAAKTIGLRGLVTGVLHLVAASSEKHKYCCLLRLLAAHSLISLPDDLDAALAAKRFKPEVNASLSRAVVADVNPEIHVIYLQPVASKADEIGFAEFADWLTSLDGDRLAARFSTSLQRWAASPAGHIVRR